MATLSLLLAVSAVTLAPAFVTARTTTNVLSNLWQHFYIDGCHENFRENQLQVPVEYLYKHRGYFLMEILSGFSPIEIRSTKDPDCRLPKSLIGSPYVSLPQRSLASPTIDSSLDRASTNKISTPSGSLNSTSSHSPPISATVPPIPSAVPPISSDVLLIPSIHVATRLEGQKVVFTFRKIYVDPEMGIEKSGQGESDPSGDKLTAKIIKQSTHGRSADNKGEEDASEGVNQKQNGPLETMGVNVGLEQMTIAEKGTDCSFHSRAKLSLQSGYSFLSCRDLTDWREMAEEINAWRDEVKTTQEKMDSTRFNVIIGVVAGTGVGSVVLFCVVCVLCRLRATREPRVPTVRRPSYSTRSTNAEPNALQRTDTLRRER